MKNPWQKHNITHLFKWSTPQTNSPLTKGGVFLLSLTFFSSFFFTNSANAQISSDGSLSTQVDTSNNINFVINQGTQVGDNLFHSFQEFSIPTNGSAVFQNDLNVRNIFNRVTGGSLSTIDGLIQTQGNANFFLINPAGILFGQNARLEIGGSFFATTANSILFDDGIEFSATNLQTPLLTVNMPLGVRFRDNPNSITNQSLNFDSNGIPLGLSVKPGKTLALVGGDVNFNTGLISAPGARVELGGLATTGTVGLNSDGGLLFPEGVLRANVSLVNLSSVNVVGSGEGSISVNSRNFDLLRGSTVFAGIASGQVTRSAQGGDITIDATDKVRIVGEPNFLSNINTSVNLLSSGDAGDVIINAASLEGIGNFTIGSTTFGEGDAGKVSITTTDNISLEGLQNTGSGIVSAVSPFAIGNADDIVIDARSLSLSNFAQLATSTVGQGNAGNIRIHASELVSVKSNSVMQAITGSSGNAGKIIIEAPDANVVFDGLGTAVSTGVSGKLNILGFQIVGTGQGGDLFIKARNLSVTDGAQIFTSTFAQGVPNNGLANAGKITINVSESTNLTRDSQLRSDTRGEGNAGNIDITTGSLSLMEGSRLLSSTYGQKNAGNITIHASDNVSFDGVSTRVESEFPVSGVFSNVESGAAGDGGNINIKAGRLSITNGAQVQTLVRRSSSDFLPGRGNSGKVTIAVDSALKLDGVSKIVNLNGANNSYSSLIATVLETGSSGSAGEIDITAKELSITNGAQLLTSTYGQGNAGNVKIDVREGVIFDGVNLRLENGFPFLISSGVQSNVEFGGIGDGGNIKIEARELSITDGAQVQTVVRRGVGNFLPGQGNSGKVTIAVDGALKLDGISEIFNFNGLDNSSLSLIATLLDFGSSGSAGEIDITARELSITNGAQLSSSTFGQGNAGNVTISTREGITFDGFGTRYENGIPDFFTSGVQSNVRSEAVGDGGNLKITGRNLSLSNGAQINTSTFGQGNAGKIFVRADDSVNLSDKSYLLSLVEAGGIGNAGDITINARSLSLINQGQIGSSLSPTINNLPGATGQGGKIEINTGDFVNISGTTSDGYSSGIFANTRRGASGRGGEIILNTNAFRVADGGVLTTQTQNASDAGNITINANTFEAVGGGQVLTSSLNQGRAGNVNINVTDTINLSGTDSGFTQRFNQFGTDVVANVSPASGIFANATPGSQGDGGNIFIDPRRIVIQDGAGIGVNSQGEGRGGSIEIQADNLILDNRAFISAETTSNQGGNITLNNSNILQLRRQSNISATAVTARGSGDGGNININTGFLVGIPREDSNITANAFGGRGGAINITTQGIFGLEVRDRLTSLSDITAFSQLSPTLNGEIILNIPDVDPSQGLVEFSQTIIDPDALVAQNPCAQRTGSEFIITGKGGLPLSPNQALSEDGMGLGLVEPAPLITTQKPSLTSENHTSMNVTEIVPAQGWVINERDEVILTAFSANGNQIQRQTRSSQGCSLK
jgi:filamentous hemagglutinin family protein